MRTYLFRVLGHRETHTQKKGTKFNVHIYSEYLEASIIHNSVQLSAVWPGDWQNMGVYLYASTLEFFYSKKWFILFKGEVRVCTVCTPGFDTKKTY